MFPSGESAAVIALITATPAAPRPVDGHGRPARATRTRPPTEIVSRTSTFEFRQRGGIIAVFVALAIAGAQLFYLQVPRAAGLRAEAAGQLGVKTGDVVGFTETMIKLGETTNLTADEASTAIAQIAN